MVNPHWAFSFIFQQPYVAFLTMGAVILTMTGGEALYADMGHFGRLPIRWLGLLWFCLAYYFNYAGQGALLLRDAEAIGQPILYVDP